MTNFQLRLFRRESLPDSMHFVDLSKVLPVYPLREFIEKLADNANDVLRYLFGDFQQPTLTVQPNTPTTISQRQAPSPSEVVLIKAPTESSFRTSSTTSRAA